MSSEERKKILQMVEEGKISAEDAAKLMRALDEDVEVKQMRLRSRSLKAEQIPATNEPLLQSSMRSRRGRVAFR